MRLHGLIHEAEREVTQGQGNNVQDASESDRSKWLVIRSNLLGGEEITLVFEKQNEQMAQQAEPGRVIYFPSEIEEIHKLKDKPECIKKIHLVKKKFDGLIEPEDSQLVRRLKRIGLWD
jgi:hypothetical protein